RIQHLAQRGLDELDPVLQRRHLLAQVAPFPDQRLLLVLVLLLGISLEISFCRCCKTCVSCTSRLRSSSSATTRFTSAVTLRFLQFALTASRLSRMYCASSMRFFQLFSRPERREPLQHLAYSVTVGVM